VVSTLTISDIAACGSSDSGGGGIDPSLATGNEGGDGTVDPTGGGGDGGAVDGAGSDDGASDDGASGDGASGDGASADGAGADAAADAGLTVWPVECMLCHGSVNPAPPKPFPVGGGNATTNRLVGAHQSHLGPSTWHHEVACSECHIVPTSAAQDPLFPTHMNGVNDVVWGPLAKSGAYSPTTESCSGTYCHGATLKTDAPGLGSNRTPKWTTVDGSQKACGTSCHTLPPGGGHPTSTACPTCHTAVIASFVPGNPPAVVWKDASLHINGQVELAGGALTCTTCHGTVATNNPAPPRGTKGELTTADQAVGAHAQHLTASTWHRDGQCGDCHTLPASTGHSNGVTDFTWGAVSTASGALPSYTPANATCSDVYCHGSKLLGARAGGVVSRSPVWNVVNGSYNACGTTCHTNPPGGTHPQQTGCPTCHGAVIATYDPVTLATTWTDRTLHINGNVEAAMTCTSCHGNGAAQINPPNGVGGEATTDTLAVGRHTAHLTASASHLAVACDTCHVVPAAGDVAHTAGYVASASLATSGHHGDVTFANQAVGMAFNVNATQGAPVTARGTCLGACHSNGRGGAPLVTPYWAGGAWPGGCGGCHAGTMATLPGRHPTHNGEATCADCHTPANAATHMNGTRDVNAAIVGDVAGGGGGVVTLAPGAPGNNCAAGQVQCNGTCHGKGHAPRCW
jgi:predicted CxxxxCH...CXXCH cytochrome family protein